MSLQLLLDAHMALLILALAAALGFLLARWSRQVARGTPPPPVTYRPRAAS
jgi:hypothetical protein